ncbi:helix-turn-helix domain-containing protein [Streptomyces sp. NPDC005533]|uniref:helix-turn-helix domain-containing protein n=1 Tax=Streptomyces sp. NPDC005533 TaxID=3364723 RepID=UPI0036A98703
MRAGGAGDRPVSGRPRRLPEAERSRIVALVRQAPPGCLTRGEDGGPAADDEADAREWTLESLAQAARQAGMTVGRSQVRRFLLAEGVRWPARGAIEGQRCRGKRTRIIGLYTDPPAGATVVCADELGPVIPRTFPPGPDWSPDDRRIKNKTDYSRGLEKTWVYRGLRVRDGQQVTMSATSRNSVLLPAVSPEAGGSKPCRRHLDPRHSVLPQQHLHPDLARGPSQDQARLHPRRRVLAHLQEAWWRIFRKAALAGQSFARPDEITQATELATAQLNRRARTRVWGRPAPPT